MFGPLAQAEERGADNAEVVSSILTRTIVSSIFSFLFYSVNCFGESKVLHRSLAGFLFPRRPIRRMLMHVTTS